MMDFELNLLFWSHMELCVLSAYSTRVIYLVYAPLIEWV